MNRVQRDLVSLVLRAAGLTALTIDEVADGLQMPSDIRRIANEQFMLLLVNVRERRGGDPMYRRLCLRAAQNIDGGL